MTDLTKILPLLLASLFFMGGCAMIERTASQSWVREWNHGCNFSSENKRACSMEDIAERMEQDDYLVLHRQYGVGLVDKEAQSVPPDPLERCAVYAVILNYYLNFWQEYNALPNPAEIPGSFHRIAVEHRKAELEGFQFQKKANVFFRKLIDANAQHSNSDMKRLVHWMVGRIEQMEGYSAPKDIPVAAGAREWRFTFNASPNTNSRTYLLSDFRTEYRRIISNKVSGFRRIAGVASVIGANGVRFDDQLAVQDGLNGVWTIQVIGKNGIPEEINGLNAW